MSCLACALSYSKFLTKVAGIIKFTMCTRWEISGPITSSKCIGRDWHDSPIESSQCPGLRKADTWKCTLGCRCKLHYVPLFRQRAPPYVNAIICESVPKIVCAVLLDPERITLCCKIKKSLSPDLFKNCYWHRNFCGNDQWKAANLQVRSIVHCPVHIVHRKV